ncbi:hypothetical protein [Nodosilinea sp. LEGE 06152]|uniref:hypothetical protein n=1 Tax=Nodosilinea sp. LEGE 06152 TaxID=2777966 RepID=UPI001D14FA53|nr:hypothetical protein [Nodosilinea sp. LEGE 06152]
MKRQSMVCGLGLCLVLASCAGVPSGSQEAAQSAAPAATQRAVGHAMGSTAVPSRPQRVVVLTNEATDMVLALGLTPVGAVKSWSGEPY